MVLAVGPLLASLLFFLQPFTCVGALPANYSVYTFRFLNIRDPVQSQTVWVSQLWLLFNGTSVDASKAFLSSPTTAGCCAQPAGPFSGLLSTPFGDSYLGASFTASVLRVTFPRAVLVDSYSWCTSGSTP